MPYENTGSRALVGARDDQENRIGMLASNQDDHERRVRALAANQDDHEERLLATQAALISNDRFHRVIVAILVVYAAIMLGGILAGCATSSAKKPTALGAYVSVPSPASAGGGGTVTQGPAAAGSGPWPVALTEDGTNTIVKTADNANKAVRVNVVAGGAAGGTSSTFGAAIPATGTAAGQSDGTNMQLPRVFDGDTGGGTQYVSGAILRKQASGGTVEAGTSADPLRVDPTGSTTQPVSGTVTITPSGTQTVAGNKTNNNAAPGATNVGAMVGIANAAAPTWSEGNLVLASVDLGGSLRALITNTVTVSGTVAATQSGAWSLAANQSVNVSQINAVTPLMGNGATGTGALRVSIANDSTGIVSQGGTWTVQPGNTPNTSPWLVSSGIAHDAVATGRDPVLGGAYASAAAPADVSADGDAVRLWALRSGALVQQLSFAGTLATTGSGNVGAGVQRVVIASDQPAFRLTVDGLFTHDAAGATAGAPLPIGGVSSATVPADVSADGDAVRAWFLRNGTQVMNPAFSGVLASAGNGASGTSVQRVTLANDSTGVLANVATIGTSVTPGTAAANLGKAEDAAHTGGDVGVMALGVRNQTGAAALSSADGDYTPIATDDMGALFTREGGPNKWHYHENSSSTLTDTTVKSACGSGLFSYITSFTVSTGAATAFNAFIEDSTTTTILGPYYLEAVSGRGFSIVYPGGKKQTTANTLISITTSAAIAHSIDITGFCAP